MDNEYGHRYLWMDFSFHLKDVELPYHFISWLSGVSFQELLGIALDNYVKSHLVKFSTEGLDIFLSSVCDPVVMLSSIVEDYLDRQYKEGCYVILFSDFTCTTMPIDRQRLNTHVSMYERMGYGVKHKILVYSDGKFKEDYYMAKRPAWAIMDNKVECMEFEFEWNSGFAVIQKQKKYYKST